MPYWTTDENGNQVYVGPGQEQAPAAPSPISTPEMDPQSLLDLIRGDTGVTRVGAGVSVSERGHDPATFERLSKDRRPEAAQALARMEEEEKARQRVSGIRQTSARLGGALAREGQAEGDLLEKQRENQAELSTYVADRAREEERAISESRAEANSIKADFQRQLAEFRSMRVNPNKIFDEQTTGQRVGTLASVFVADFLGAKGIKTSVMDTINRAIDRSIDAQKADIDTQGRALEGTQNLWNMQRAQSQSDAEARARVRAMMLQSFKDEVESRLGVYESALASAKAQSALAKVDVELVNAVNQVNFHADQNANARAQEIGALYRARLDASLRARALKVQEDAAKAAAQQKTADMQLLDTTRSGQNKVIGNFVRGTEIEHRDLRRQVNNFAKMEAVMDRFQNWRAKHGTVPDGLSGTRWVSEASRAYDTMIENLVSEIVYERTGAASAEAERATLRRLIPKDTWLTQGGQDQPYAALRQHYRDKINAQVAQYTDNPRVMVGSPDKGYEGIDPGGYTADKAILEGKTGPETDALSKDIGAVTDRLADKPDPEASGNSREDWAEFGKSGQAPASFYDVKSKDFFPKEGESGYTESSVPKWASSMSDMSVYIEQFQKSPPEPGNERWEVARFKAQRAFDELMRHATDVDTGVSEQSEKSRFQNAYAQYLLLKLGALPDEPSIYSKPEPHDVTEFIQP